MKKRGWVLVAALALVAAACGGDEATVDEGGDGGTIVAVTMEEFSITPSASSASAGEISFQVTNAGAQLHDFVIIRTELTADGLPVTGTTVDVQGENVEVIDGLEPFSPGTQTLTVDLVGGAYVFICNVPTHYEAGMHASFEAS